MASLSLHKFFFVKPKGVVKRVVIASLIGICILCGLLGSIHFYYKSRLEVKKSISRNVYDEVITTQKQQLSYKSRAINLAIWKQMRLGMTEYEVKDLLGDPNGVIPINNSLYSWHYPGKSIRFTNQRVIGWH